MQKMQTVVAGGLEMAPGQERIQGRMYGGPRVQGEKSPGALDQSLPVGETLVQQVGKSTGRGSALDRTPSRKKKELKGWISSGLGRLRGLEQGLKETPRNRIDRLEAVPAEEVIRRAEATQARGCRAICASSVQHGSGSRCPKLKTNTTVDFLFKSCNLYFRQFLSLLEQLREQLQKHRREQRHKKTQGKGAADGNEKKAARWIRLTNPLCETEISLLCWFSGL